MARQKLLIEMKSEELIAEVARLCRLVRYPCQASRHAEKSADSCYLSVGEAVSVFAPRVKAAKYDVARGEAGEVQKGLTSLVLKGKLKPDQIAKAMDIADHIIAMATNLIKNLEKRF